MFTQADPEVEANDGDTNGEGCQTTMGSVLPVIERRAKQRCGVCVEGGGTADGTCEDATAKEGEDKAAQRGCESSLLAPAA